MAETTVENQLGSLRDEDAEGRDWSRVRPREISDQQWRRYEGYMREIFQSMGMQLETPGTEKTPQRFLRALFDST